MKPTDRARLTTALRDHVARIAADLRAKMRAPGTTRVRAQQLHADEQVADDFDVWTDLLSRRAAVLWVLKSVYVRVLEDRGLLAPGRLLDLEAQQLFERLAPHLGETAFLRWVYRDLASSNGGLPELFSPQPAEIAFPSDELSRGLMAFWRHRDADTGVHWSFVEEHFDGGLMGDLYQDLDPVVKERFSLCQTPHFVRSFILDRALTPAIETFGADQVRLLDPACGSGHFLIDGLKRIVTATAATHSNWERGKVVAHVLDRVVGIDLNDYACALARTRLVMTAAELAGVTTLADAAHFHPHVYWADGLEQVERDEHVPRVQLDLYQEVKDRPRATFTRSDVRAALRTVLGTKFSVVVANPPYGLEPDTQKKTYHREKIGGRRRYLSSHGKYSLAAPFTERCLQLAAPDGFIGVIVANNFMTREFGQPLIEQVLARVDLQLIIDTAGAILATSGFETPTAMLFLRNRHPASGPIRVVAGKKGDTSRAGDPSQGPVWTSIAQGWSTVGFANDFISVMAVEREDMSKYPWSLGTTNVADLKSRLEHQADCRLGDVAEEIGFDVIVGQDELFVGPRGWTTRLGVDDSCVAPFVEGGQIRDWRVAPREVVIFPYSDSLEPRFPSNDIRTRLHFARYRALLAGRQQFGKTAVEAGLKWFEFRSFYKAKRAVPKSICYAAIATHGQFVLTDTTSVFKQSAPLVKLSAEATLPEWLTVTGLMNSSTLGFWLRRVLHKVGGRSSGTRRQSEEWAQRRDFAAGLLEKAPLVCNSPASSRIAELAQALLTLGQDLLSCAPASLLSGRWEPTTLRSALESARKRTSEVRDRMVAIQEELDWEVYGAFGLLRERPQSVPVDDIEPLASAHRPFAIRLARLGESTKAASHWFAALNNDAVTDVPNVYREDTQSRLRHRIASTGEDEALSLIETPEHKRKWEPIAYAADQSEAAFDWLSERVEELLSARTRPHSLAQIAAALQDDERFLTVASIYQNRPDVDVPGLVSEVLAENSVPSHDFHVYTDSGITKRAAWLDVWSLQRREDAGGKAAEIPVPPEYSQGSRGKTTDFRRPEYWKLRGALDVPKERFIAFTEVPGRTRAETLYGWAGWTPLQRLKAILAIDEGLEDNGVALADRVGLLDTAWSLLPDVAEEDVAAATRLKAELQALVGPNGPSRELIDNWKKRFPPPNTRARRTMRTASAREEKEFQIEENDES